MHTKPLRRLEIRKGQEWELWLISPVVQTRLGSFQDLEELNAVQITLYRAWEKSHYPLFSEPQLPRQ